jgi:dopamine beta-monooxygenase
MILQIHYENLYDLKDQIDSSGVKMYTTPHLRKMDIGLINTGVMMNEIAIPPKTPEYEISRECDNTCTSEDINVFYYFWHMHLIGKRYFLIIILV